MNKFEFSNKVVENILQELRRASKYIRIAVFQIHHEDVFALLTEKLQQGVKVEIFTLPYDSINLNVQPKVTALFQKLKSNGAQLHFCRWNVGDPERTSTAIGRWYSFHGKFIVTDKSAISLSANFTTKNELDCSLISNDAKMIAHYNSKFDELYDLFIKDTNGYSGSIRKKILGANPNANGLFNLPKIIETKTHEKHWIHHYPSSLCPQSITTKDGLFIAPFDIRGRSFYEDIIKSAKKFVFISTESFTDTDFADFLINTSLKDLKINILTGATSMDFADRMQAMLRDLLANNIKVKTINEDLHGKLLLTEKHLIISSINLNKMNLGFNKTSQFWRENTETITVCTDKAIISEAKKQFCATFKKATDIEDVLVKKLLSKVGNVFSKYHGIKSDKEAKSLFAKFLLKQEIYVKKLATTVAKISGRIITKLKKKKVCKNEFIMSLIMYFLTERKLSPNEIKDKIDVLDTAYDLSSLLNILVAEKFIEKDGDYYKIKVT
jgi:cell fate (sporulation/competence/biofilm development) regulator YlbF (YheA/YmcA/DUF963 family)